MTYESTFIIRWDFFFFFFFGEVLVVGFVDESLLAVLRGFGDLSVTSRVFFPAFVEGAASIPAGRMNVEICLGG